MPLVSKYEKSRTKKLQKKYKNEWNLAKDLKTDMTVGNGYCNRKEQTVDS